MIIRAKVVVLRLLLSALLLSSLNTAHAYSVNGNTLVQGCEDLLGIYDRSGSKRLLAGFSTSVAEAMRAGICLGMIEGHRKHKQCGNSSYGMAKRIAVAPGYHGSSKLLDQACGR